MTTPAANTDEYTTHYQIARNKTAEAKQTIKLFSLAKVKKEVCLKLLKKHSM